jgi:hypothetical protein
MSTTRSPGSTRARRTAGLLAGGVAAALALAACGTQVAGSGGDGSPPVLHIGSRAVPAAGADAATGKGGGTSSGYQLGGDLPDGPSSAPTARFDTGGSLDDVARLSAALGLTAKPVAHDYGWVVTDGDGVLRVRKDGAGAWSFSRATGDCQAYGIDVDHPASAAYDGVACASATTPGTKPPAAPSSADALAAAAPVIAAAGVDASPKALGDNGIGARTVVADPSVAGLPTAGLRTSVDVSTDGVTGAFGYLGDAAASDVYPLLSAQKVFDSLVAMPRAMPLIACPEPAPGDESAAPVPDVCASPYDPKPISITGAVLGLSLAFDGDEPVLVPSWLFSVEGWDDPLVAVAVDDAFLADPEPGTGTGGGSVPPGTGGEEPPPVDEPGAGSSGEPGSGGVEPTDPGLSPEPVPSGPAQPGVEQPAVDRAIVSGADIALIFWGGVCSEYAASAEETATTVTVSVVGRSTLGPDQACIEIAKESKASITLAAPLGDRALIDAATGRPITVARA